MKLLNESKIGGQTVMLRWRDGQAQVFGRQDLRIGEEGVSDCWLRWAWDGSRFVLDTDRFGLRPVYWAQTGDDLIVGLDLRDLLAAGVSSQLDDQCVATFLCLGSYLSEATPFRAIQALPPGATLVWERGSISVTSRMRWPRPDSSISRDAAIGQYIELFHAAIARRAERTSEIVLPLSGGLDSTHILLAMKHAGVQPETCVTVEDWFSDNTADVEAARESARRLGLHHCVLSEPVSLIAAQRWVRQSIGIRGSAHFWAMPLYAYFEARRPDGFFDGLGGDNLSASSFVSRNWTDYLDHGRLPELADAIILRNSGDAHDRATIVPSLWQRFPKEAARNVIVTELGRQLEYANPIGRFMFLNRMRTLIAPLATVAMGRFSRPFFPFLDDSVFEFLAALPVSYMFDKSFHRDAIARAYGREWPASIVRNRPSRMVLRRVAHWREVMSAARLHYSALQRVLQHPARVLNPLRWATFEHQHNAFLSATYMAHLLDLESGAADASSSP